MNLLIIGSDRGISIERYYNKYLLKNNIDSKIFPSRDKFIDKYEKSYYTKIKLKLGFNDIYKSINTELLQYIEHSTPDIVFVFKGMEINPKTLIAIKKKNVKLVNYNPDNPFIFSGRGSGNEYIKKSIGLYDFHFTYNLEIKKQLEEKYKAKTALLPFAFDINQQLFDECAKETEIVKACFLGNLDKMRATFLIALANKGIRIDVYGHDIEKYVSHKNITAHQPVYGNLQWKTLRKYRVQINLMRIHNENSHNMRTFEVPGIGGIQVAPFTKEHQMFFEDGKEIFLYRNIDECVSKINYLLSLSTHQASELRGFARNAAIQKKHSYEDRAFQVLTTLNELK